MNRLFYLLVALCWPLFALGSGEQYGKLAIAIYDENGDLLPGVNLTLDSISLVDGPREGYSEDGTYVFEKLPAGRYELTAQRIDKEKYVRKNIQVNVGKTQYVHFPMETAFIPHEGISKSAREEITYCTGVEPQEPLLWKTPGEIFEHKDSVVRPLVKTLEEMLAAELTSKTITRSSRQFKKEVEEIYPSPKTVQQMRVEVAARRETLLAAAFIKQGFHPYSVVAFIGFNNEIYAIRTYISWSDVVEKWVARISPEQFEAFLDATTTVLDCAMTADEPTFNNGPGSSLMYWNPSGIPMQCNGDFFSMESSKFGGLLFKILEGEKRTDRDLSWWESFLYSRGKTKRFGEASLS